MSAQVKQYKGLVHVCVPLLIVTECFVCLVLPDVKLSASYGPVMTLHLANQRLVVLVGYDVIKEALVENPDDFTSRGPIPLLVRATRGYGGFTIKHIATCNRVPTMHRAMKESPQYMIMVKSPHVWLW